MTSRQIPVDNRNSRKRSEVCSKLTIKTPERRHCCRCGAFIVNFERISPFSKAPIVDIEHVNVCWVEPFVLL